jgi:nickel/cobalt transporter (NicO) family protein
MPENSRRREMLLHGRHHDSSTLPHRMLNPADILQQTASYGWFFAPTAVALGALHGLEPGHSKTLMAAFIVAIRGSVGQAILLGLAATVSHTAIVWLVALAGMRLGQHFSTGAIEPLLQSAAGAVIISIALWMIFRTWRQLHHHAHPDSDHDHDENDDEHARAHAEQLRRTLQNRTVSNGRIVMFGLTGGLVPCPASITVLMVCLQLRQLALGMLLVLCFSLGLALTLVSSGVIAALGVRHAQRHWHGFGDLARRAPYLSGVLMLLVGLYMGWTGLRG